MLSLSIAPTLAAPGEKCPRASQYTDPDARLAFSFLDAARGWIAGGTRPRDEPKMISTRDGGRHWQSASPNSSCKAMQFIDDTPWVRNRGRRVLSHE